MTNRAIVCFAGALCLGLLVASPAHAQSFAASTPQATASVAPAGDVFGGIAWWAEDEASLSGFHLSASWRPAPKFAVVGDMTFYGDHSSLMGGVRVQSTGRHSMFLQVLAGRAPFDDFAIQPGLGFDYRINPNLAARAAFDVKFAGDDGSTYIATRLSFGLVYVFGR